MSGVARAFSVAVGPLFQLAAGIIASITDVDLSLGNLIAGGLWSVPRGGTLIGFSRSQGATAVTAGTLTVRVLKNGVSATTQAVTSGANSFVTLTTPVVFASGDTLSFQVSTDISYVGAALIGVVPQFNMG